jgi:hypothetical protein
MLGGGNPVSSSSPSGIGTSINYIGNRVFGYSGIVAVQTSDTNLLKFTTGSNLLIATVQCFNTENSAELIKWQISFDSQIVSQYHSEGRGSAEREHGNQIPLVIAPYTEVKIFGECQGGSPIGGCALFTGKIVG